MTAALEALRPRPSLKSIDIRGGARVDPRDIPGYPVPVSGLIADIEGYRGRS